MKIRAALELERDKPGFSKLADSLLFGINWSTVISLATVDLIPMTTYSKPYLN
jgi:hypothetical protein